MKRRDFISRGVLAGGAILGGLTATPSRPVAAAQDISQAVGEYMQARGRVMDSGSASDVREALAYIDLSNVPLREFVTSDLLHLSRVIRSHGPLLGVDHTFTIQARDGYRVRVYEETRFTWKHSLPPGFVMPTDPRARPTTRSVIESSFGYTHTLMFEPSGSSLFVKRDAFRGASWDSPDVGLVTEMRQPIWAARPPLESAASVVTDPEIGARRGMGRLARPLAAQYFWDAAVNYCYTYARTPNPNYFDYTGNGGDCTSFISQALANAGWTAGDRNDPNAYWYDAAVVPWVGTAWYDNNNQRPWILNNARGWAAPGTPQDVLRGDIVYYDWATGGYGPLEHTVMVTTITGTGRRLVSCHTPNENEIDWDTFWAPHLRPFVTHNMRLFTFY